ncbi:MAG: DnaD domain protein [Dehalococcoidales bacterium]|nr:DnaD domain protein [Dehalococcoidales bacterium]
MKQFNGFPVKTKYTPIPNIFFSSVLPEISDIAELKVTLHFWEILYPKKGYPKYVSRSKLLSDIALLRSLKGLGQEPEAVLQKALKLAEGRGTILRITLDKDSTAEDIYLLNTEADRQAAAKIQSGELKLTGLETRTAPANLPEEQPDVFRLYEDNIGMLTPIVADELREAEKLYPADWIRDAFKEAVVNNKRNWRYIARILERWTTEGKSDGTHRRYLKEDNDPDKYIKGKYGHIVRR